MRKRKGEYKPVPPAWFSRALNLIKGFDLIKQSNNQPGLIGGRVR